MQYPLLSRLVQLVGAQMQKRKVERECQRKECKRESVSVVCVAFYTTDDRSLGRAVLDLPLCYEHAALAILEDAVDLVGEQTLQGLTKGVMLAHNFKPGQQLRIQVEKVEFTDPDYLRLKKIQAQKKAAGG